MTVEQGLVAHLLADATVSGIVGNAVHPGKIPQGAGLPAIVYSRTSSIRENTLDGPSELVKVRMRVDCWHTTYPDAKALATAVRVALNGVGLASPRLLGAEPVQMVTLDSDADVGETQGDEHEHRVAQDWTIIHTET